MADPTTFPSFLEISLSGQHVLNLTSSSVGIAFAGSIAASTTSATINLPSSGVYEFGVISGILTPGGFHQIVIRDDAESVGTIFLIPCGSGASVVRKIRVTIPSASGLDIKVRNNNAIGAVSVFIQNTGN